MKLGKTGPVDFQNIFDNIRAQSSLSDKHKKSSLEETKNSEDSQMQVDTDSSKYGNCLSPDELIDNGCPNF